MSELSVFVDESGDVGRNSSHHLVTLVFHDQSLPIDDALAGLGRQLGNLEFPLDKAIHTGPLVRRELEYANMDVVDRKKVFSALYNFAMKAKPGLSYAVFSYRKSELGAGPADAVEPLLQARIARDLKLFLGDRMDYFTAFDRVIVYYDNGQHAVAAAVREAFEDKLFGVDFRRVQPSSYRLFQVADLVCTLELLRIKDGSGGLSRSELRFFGSPGRLRKDYLRQIERLRLG